MSYKFYSRPLKALFLSLPFNMRGKQVLCQVINFKGELGDFCSFYWISEESITCSKHNKMKLFTSCPVIIC